MRKERLPDKGLKNPEEAKHRRVGTQRKNNTTSSLDMYDHAAKDNPIITFCVCWQNET
jgi:hypothetical protein